MTRADPRSTVRRTPPRSSAAGFRSTASVLQAAPDMIGIAGTTSMIQVWTSPAVNAAAPEDVVYKVTGAIYENKPALEAAFGSFRQLSQDGMADGHANPWHPGAIKFYTEVSRWKEPRR